MFSRFKYERIPLSLIKLDQRNPRIVMLQPPKNDEEILRYFFEHENLASFLKKVAAEGRNAGAERPYIVKSGKEYVVIEGNTRIAAYKLLTGQLAPPEDFAADVPHVPTAFKEDLASIDCSIAPSRDALLPIMANAHFGLGDKSRWGYLGSRKAVYEEWKAGKSINQLASVFNRKPGEVRDLLIEYQLYLDAIELGWTPAERAELEKPDVAFNPPVRFLQSTGHKSAVGIEFDKVNLAVTFLTDDSKAKFKHLVKKLVVSPEKGLGATSSYKEVFKDYVAAPKVGSGGASGGGGSEGGSSGGRSGGSSGGGGGTTSGGEGGTASGGSSGSGTEKPKLKKGALFAYPVTSGNNLIQQIMKEAKDLNTEKFPAAGTALLRSVLEAILKTIIDDQGANPEKKQLSLENAINVCLSKAVQLSQDDKRVINEFKNHHLDYVNLGTHATVVPNALRLMAARDCVDQFVMRNV